jgi:DNA-binding MarR family transcriptional regulator
MNPDPRHCTCMTLRAATRRLTQRYDHALAPTGLRAGQFSMLSLVKEYPRNPSVTELADYFDMTISTATRNLRPLVDAGYLSIKADHKDARRREVTLTKRGRRVLEKAHDLWAKTQSAVMKELGPNRHEKLHELLALLR